MLKRCAQVLSSTRSSFTLFLVGLVVAEACGIDLLWEFRAPDPNLKIARMSEFAREEIGRSSEILLSFLVDFFSSKDAIFRFLKPIFIKEI